jgi:microcompartment protein CcmL/EutN
MKTSLGLLEVAGLALAIKVADIMAKSANIKIAGIERTKGSGWMLVSITGDVAAVQSAITNGAQFAHREKGWVADRVIPRPASALDRWLDPGEAPIDHPASATEQNETASEVTADDAVNDAPATVAEELVDQSDIAVPASENPADDDAHPSEAAESMDQTDGAVPASESPADDDATNASPSMALELVELSVGIEPASNIQPTKRSHHKAKTGATDVAATASCNLCHDPACPRDKGEPRAACIHYNERGK